MFGSGTRAATTQRTASTRRAWSAIAVALLTASSLFLTSSIASATPVTVNIKRYALLEPTDGTVDTSFNNNTLAGFNNVISGALEQPDGKILIVGSFSAYNGSAIPAGIGRLNADGTRDATFNVGGAGVGGQATTFALLPSGKILLAGGFSLYNGVSVPTGLIRLNSDGTLDNTFNTGGAGFGYTQGAQIFHLNVLSNGQILVGGVFTTYNGNPAGYFVRLNADGTLDNTFNNGGAGFNERVEGTAVLSDGSILTTGWFSTYNGVATPLIAKLSSTGVLDTSFTMGGPAGAGPARGHPYTLKVQPDGKILLIGDIHTWNGATAGGIVRLNSDGTTDTSFNSGTGFPILLPNTTRRMYLQPDGKIIVVGNATSYNGTAITRIVRLTSTGALDPTFIAGFDAVVADIIKLTVGPNAGKLVVGNFTSSTTMEFPAGGGSGGGGGSTLADTGASAGAAPMALVALAILTGGATLLAYRRRGRRN